MFLYCVYVQSMSLLVHICPCLFVKTGNRILQLQCILLKNGKREKRFGPVEVCESFIWFLKFMINI